MALGKPTSCVGKATTAAWSTNGVTPVGSRSRRHPCRATVSDAI
ncbi:hypothetical protein AB5I41_07705 [Sphingomonas sp. MMS24-JH45]